MKIQNSENLKVAYKHTFDKDLEGDIAGDLSGDLKHWCVAVLAGARDEVNAYQNVEADVQALHGATSSDSKTALSRNEVFLSVFATRGIGHLQRVFAVYAQRHGKSLEDVVKKEFSGDMEKAMLHFVHSVVNYPLWVADQFQSAFQGLGTNEAKLIRLVCHRCAARIYHGWFMLTSLQVVRTRNPLLGIVKQAFQHKHNRSLVDATKSETSGELQKALVTLLEQ